MEALPPVPSWVSPWAGSITWLTPLASAAMFAAALAGLGVLIRQARKAPRRFTPWAPTAECRRAVLFERRVSPVPGTLPEYRPAVFLAATVPQRAPPTFLRRLTGGGPDGSGYWPPG